MGPGGLVLQKRRLNSLCEDFTISRPQEWYLPELTRWMLPSMSPEVLRRRRRCASGSSISLTMWSQLANPVKHAGNTDDLQGK
jgi:hypothetical protein